jgi:hypothetical protein
LINIRVSNSELKKINPGAKIKEKKIKLLLLPYAYTHTWWALPPLPKRKGRVKVMKEKGIKSKKELQWSSF